MKQTSEHPMKLVRRACVPLVAFETADPNATISTCQQTFNGNPMTCLIWDCVRGLRGATKEANEIAKEYGDALTTVNLPQCLSLIAKDPPKETVLFIHGAARMIDTGQQIDPTVVQAIWNLRDLFKSKEIGSHLVLLSPSFKLPPELSGDVPIFEEPIPTEEDIMAQVNSVVEDALQQIPEFTAPKPDELPRIVDTLTGYQAMFTIEQALALSIGKTGIDHRRLWELKVSSMKSTAGLEISQPTTTFDDLAGAFGVKAFLRMLINGRERFKGLFFLDEIEKMLAGGQGDLSGTSQAMIEQFLYWTEAKRVLGLLLIGVPGAGKSWTAQCTAGEARVPLLRGSMSTVKGSLVGQSEANMKAMLKTIDSITQGRTLMIATCNSLDALTPEIMARFKLGTIFYDYPTKEEADALWKLYGKKYELGKFNVPDTAVNWVPREIESCCHRAWLFNVPISDAVKTVVPVCKANRVKMEALRESASGRFLSAATEGTYQYDKNQTVSSGRKLGE